MNDTPVGHMTAIDLDVEILILAATIARSGALPSILMRADRNASAPPGARTSGEAPPAGVPALPEADVLLMNGVLSAQPEMSIVVAEIAPLAARIMPITIAETAEEVATIEAAELATPAGQGTMPVTSERTSVE